MMGISTNFLDYFFIEEKLLGFKKGQVILEKAEICKVHTSPNVKLLAVLRNQGG